MKLVHYKPFGHVRVFCKRRIKRNDGFTTNIMNVSCVKCLGSIIDWSQDLMEEVEERNEIDPSSRV